MTLMVQHALQTFCSQPPIPIIDLKSTQFMVVGQHMVFTGR